MERFQLRIQEENAMMVFLSRMDQRSPVKAHRCGRRNRTLEGRHMAEKHKEHRESLA
jgi:hypothetical protein